MQTHLLLNVHKPVGPKSPGRKMRIIAAFLAVGIFSSALYAALLVRRLTDVSPTPVPVETLPPSELDALETRIYEFQQALRQQRPAKPLQLNTADMNTLVAAHPGMKAAKGRLRFNLDEAQPSVQTSFQLRELGVPLIGNRYFNGSIWFSVGMEQNRLVLRATRIESTRRAMPGWLIWWIRGKNLAIPVNNDTRFAITLESLADIQAANGQLLIYPKLRAD